MRAAILLLLGSYYCGPRPESHKIIDELPQWLLEKSKCVNIRTLCILLNLVTC